MTDTIDASRNLVAAIMDEKPTAAAETFHDIISAKLSDNLDAYKKQIAAQMFGNEPVELDTSAIDITDDDAGEEQEIDLDALSPEELENILQAAEGYDDEDDEPEEEDDDDENEEEEELEEPEEEDEGEYEEEEEEDEQDD